MNREYVLSRHTKKSHIFFIKFQLLVCLNLGFNTILTILHLCQNVRQMLT
jgi:hypothetical protein